MSISITKLSKYLSEHDSGPSMEFTVGTKGDLPWNGLSCLSVVCYVLKLCSGDSEQHRDILDTVRRLNGLATEYEAISQGCSRPFKGILQDISFHYDVLRPDGITPLHEDMIVEPSPQLLEKGRQITQAFMWDFMPKVREFFSVPAITNDQLAGFIDFLLQILNEESCQNYVPHEGDDATVKFLQKHLQRSLMFHKNNLRILLAVLGDTLFQNYTEIEEVQNLLTEFGAVANEAGRNIFSFIFRTRPVNVMQIHLHTRYFVKKANELTDKIEEYCIVRLSDVQPLPVNPNNIDAVDSLLIVDSLLEDVEIFTTCRDRNLTSDHDIVKGQITTLGKFLMSAKSFLQDTINVASIHQVKECIVQIRDIAYEADYLINSFRLGNFPAWYLAHRIPSVIQKLKLIGKRSKELNSGNYGTLKLEEEDVSSEASLPTPAAAVDDGHSSTVVGFEDEMRAILGELTGGSRNLQIISIHGMPGLGKTTLAKKLYNHQLITNHFDDRAWCVISHLYRKRKVLIEIMLSLRKTRGKENILKMDDDSLITEIYRTLKGRRYFIVMDDVWDSDVWDDFRRYFPDDCNGSRILCTTRIRNTAPSNSINHTPPFLSEDKSWELLEKKVFFNEPCPPELQDPGRRIAAKCNGLPLAVVVIAGTLANMARDKCTWEKVEENLDKYARRNCMSVIELSYRHLPSHLKLCFLYLGIFPQDAEIPVRKLLRLWIIEGFVLKDDYKSQEDVAEEYLTDLINRSLVLVARTRSTGGVKTCNVHDLLHDMCLEKAKEGNILKLIKDSDDISIHEKHHRLCILSTAPASFRPLSLCCRSLFGHLSDPSSCLPQMNHLRVMELSSGEGMSRRCRIKRLDQLMHLKYLVINGMIPEQILHKLVNLEVLCLETMLEFVEVTSIIENIVKLKHLHARPYATFYNHLDSQSQPKNLLSFSNIFMPFTEDYQCLRSLIHLQKLTCTCRPILPDFSILSKLETLKVAVSYLSQDIPRERKMISLPLTIVKLSLSGTQLPWELMSIIGRLPELLALKLFWDAFEGDEWKTSEDEFQKLRFLEIGKLELKRWITMGEHFPRLCHLLLVACNGLETIPLELGDISTLRKIEVHECSYEASISAVQIEKVQCDYGNEDLQVFITNRRWSKDQLVSEYNQMDEEQLLVETPTSCSSAADQGSFHTSRQQGTSNIKIGMNCDFCEMSLIFDDVYKCKDCKERTGYHLCKDCYLSRRFELLPGRYTQTHTSEHKFEIVTSNNQTLTQAGTSSSSSSESAPPKIFEQPAPTVAPASSPTHVAEPQPPRVELQLDPHAEAASNAVTLINTDLPQLFQMFDGTWDEEKVTPALRSIFYLERAVDYLHSEILDGTDIVVPSCHPTVDPVLAIGAAYATPISGAPSSSSQLNLFLQEVISGVADAGAGSVDFLRNNPKLQGLRSMIEANPSAEPVLQELLTDHLWFLQLINDRDSPQEGMSGDDILKLLRSTPQFDTLRPMLQANPQFLEPILQELKNQHPSLSRHIQEIYEGIRQLIDHEPVGNSQGDLRDPSARHASNLVTGSNLKQTMEQLIDMGGGSWDKETVMSALRAAFNNPERAVEYLYSGIPDGIDVAGPSNQTAMDQPPSPSTSHSMRVSGAPSSSSLNLLPQGIISGPGVDILDITNSIPEFHAFRPMFRANPQLIEEMLCYIGKDHPPLQKFIQQNYLRIVQFILNEPVSSESSVGPIDSSAHDASNSVGTSSSQLNLLPQESISGAAGTGVQSLDLQGDTQDQPEQDVESILGITPEELEAIKRMEAMGFDRDLVIVALFACDRKEDLAVKYLLENSGDF